VSIVNYTLNALLQTNQSIVLYIGNVKVAVCVSYIASLNILCVTQACIVKSIINSTECIMLAICMNYTHDCELMFRIRV